MYISTCLCYKNIRKNKEQYAKVLNMDNMVEWMLRFGG